MTLVEHIWAREPVAPDLHSITRFEPYVTLSLVERDLLLAVVEAAEELDRAFEHAEEPEKIENELLLRWGGMSNALDALYKTPAAATAASSEEETP